jgi:hypothetical protein
MQDRERYRQILGIEAPWFVERVEQKLAGGCIFRKTLCLERRQI